MVVPRYREGVGVGGEGGGADIRSLLRVVLHARDKNTKDCHNAHSSLASGVFHRH